MACTLKLVKLLLIVFNAAFVVIGVAVAAIAIWSIVEKIYVSDIIGTSLFSTASYLLILAGIIIIGTAILGFILVNKYRKLMLAVYFFVQLVIFLLLIVGAVLAISFKGELEDSMKNAMTKTLTQRYGVDSSTTNAWDKVQKDLRCCAVVGEDWRLYQQTHWFANQHPLSDKKYVPETCCLFDEYRGKYSNLPICQQWKLGPPTNPTTGMRNHHLYYKGCYVAAKAFVVEHADIILAVGFAFGFFMIFGLALTVLLYRLWSVEEKNDEIKRRRQPDNL